MSTETDKPPSDDHMELARMIAAQCWCDEETKSISMDVRLVGAFAKRLALWMDDAARYGSNADYWRHRAENAERELAVERDKNDRLRAKNKKLLKDVELMNWADAVGHYDARCENQDALTMATFLTQIVSPQNIVLIEGKAVDAELLKICERWAKSRDRLRAENEALREFVTEFADMPCSYTDGCTEEAMHKNHHYRCLPCKARAALAAEEKGE